MSGGAKSSRRIYIIGIVAIVAGTGLATGYVTDPDGDGLQTGQEMFTHRTNPMSSDSDYDGLRDDAEIIIGSNPLVQDSDGDLVEDGREVNELKTSPLNTDTDGDGISDWLDRHPNHAFVDRDEDGLPDDKEKEWGYSTGENDVRLTIHIQKSADYDEYRAGIEKAAAMLAKEYKEKNPLHINLHVDYGEDLPAGKILTPEDVDNQILSNITLKNSEASFGGEYKYHAYFIEDWFTGPASNAIGLVGHKFFNIRVDSYLVSQYDYPSFMKTIMGQELGNTLGLEDSANPNSAMADTPPAPPHDWRKRTEYPAEEWDKSKMNFKFDG